MRTTWIVACGLALTLATGASAQNGPGLLGTYTIVGRAGSIGTTDISDSGMIVGWMGNSGFTYRNGELTPFVAPPVDGLPSAFSQIYGVNNAGDTVGEYFAVGVDPTGFLNRNGVLTTIAFPDAAARRTIPHDVNNFGHVAGFFQVSTGHTIGFLLRKGVYERIEIPDARYVAILGMNDADQLVGNYTVEGDPTLARHGFLWSQGVLTPIEYPGAEETEPNGIGRDGTIVGSYTKTVNGLEKQFAFVLRDGQYETIGIPGVLQNSATGINARGQISGMYFTIELDFDGNFAGSASAAWILAP